MWLSVCISTAIVLTAPYSFITRPNFSVQSTISITNSIPFLQREKICFLLIAHPFAMRPNGAFVAALVSNPLLLQQLLSSHILRYYRGLSWWSYYSQRHLNFWWSRCAQKKEMKPVGSQGRWKFPASLLVVATGRAGRSCQRLQIVFHGAEYLLVTFAAAMFWECTEEWQALS